MEDEKHEWWEKTVVYQIYPRSFKDNNGDGIGDLKGIIEKLDYVQELGVETVWFSPFFKSPQRDHGYDITDFYDIAPEYGDMNDFNTLIKEMHDRGMKIVLDMVLNHTSVDHPWFIESASSKDNPKRDWYIWRDGRKPGGKKPPNNWKQMTGGCAWTYYENTDQWVYHHFLPSMIDLNYRNPEVKEEMFNVMRFWLDKGVDGFRLDILHAIYEDEKLRNDKFSWHVLPSNKRVDVLFRKHLYDLNLPETYNFALELRKLVDEYEPSRFLVAEVFGSMEQIRKYYGPNNDGVHACFLFEFTSTKFNAIKYRKVIQKIEYYFPIPLTPTYVYGNHDLDRYIFRLKNNINKAKLLATLQLTLRGIPFIYYGEEIGMSNVKFKLKESQDPVGIKFSKFPIAQLSAILGVSLTRDVCRTPMQWDHGPNAGFSINANVKPWLRIADNYKTINVETEKKDPNSLLNCYKALLRIRQSDITLQVGKIEFLNLGKQNKNCLAYFRKYGKENRLVLLNFSEKEISIPVPSYDFDMIFSTSPKRSTDLLMTKENDLKLFPLEGIITKIKN
ncbi:MAG: glycoside hydrolase family 13 protein [Promethearchaeota archaeon]